MRSSYFLIGLNFPYLGLFSMTNTKAILGISFAAVFAVAMIFAPNVSASGSHLDITKSEYDVKAGSGKLEIKTSGDIPTDGSAGAFGYGVITGFDSVGPANVLALTTHMCAADSPLQGPDGNCPDGSVGVLTALTGGDVTNEDHDGAEIHAHILDLKTATSDCSSVENSIGLEVDLPRSLDGTPFGAQLVDFQDNNLLAGTGITGAGDYDIKVDDGEITVTGIPSADLAGDEALVIVSFGIHGIANDDAVITNLCLTSGE